MAHVYKDRVKETTTTTGTGTLTLAGAATGFQSFSAIGNGNTCTYCIDDGTNWEVGIGTYTLSGTTLSRTTIIASSNSGSAVNFGAGTKNVYCVASSLDYGEGTAFPSSPRTNQRFFRTDLGLLCYYDGTRWLTVQEICAPFHMGAHTYPIPLTATQAGYAVQMVDRSQAGIYVTRCEFTTYVTTTTNATHYWTIQPTWYASTGGPTNLGSSFNTSADTASTYTKHSVTVNSVLTTAFLITFDATKTSSPGSLYVMPALLYYRLILT